jgi:hypothetical protein
LVAVSHVGGIATLLTQRRIIEIVGDSQTATALLQPLRTRPIASVHVAPASIFIGFNAGEWGGGLQRIDRKTGEVWAIERNTSGELCGGPLNTECDPVNDIAAEPWKPECIAVAVGLVHFAPHGRIVEVCGDIVRRLYVKPHGKQPPENEVTRKYDEPFSTVAFFGLKRRAETLWAVGMDGIYQIGPRGVTQSAPLPKFKQVGGLSVSFDLPDVVVVLTDINQRLSIKRERADLGATVSRSCESAVPQRGGESAGVTPPCSSVDWRATVDADGTTLSPWRYDGAAYYALSAATLRPRPILPCALLREHIVLTAVQATLRRFNVCPLVAGRAESVRPRARTMRMTVPNSGLPVSPNAL